METAPKSSLFALLAILSLSACSFTEKDGEPVEQKITEQTANCPILKSEKWYAWVDKFTEKDGQYRLVVNGEITLPNPAFEMKWSAGRTDRMYPPGIRLSLLPKKLDQMSIQVLSTVPVNYTLETPISEYSSVSIFCGDKLLSRIEGAKLTD